MPSPANMASMSDADLVTLVALGDDLAKAEVDKRDKLSKAKAAGVDPPEPASPPDPQEQKVADGGQKQPAAKSPLDKGARLMPESAKKAKTDEEEDDDEEPDEDEDDAAEKGCHAKKSVSVGEDALIKAVEMVTAVARQAAEEPTDRRAVLAKALADGTIDDDGKAELRNLLTEGEPMAKGFESAALSDPDVTGKITDPSQFDVSGYLARLSSFVGGALDKINGDISEQLNKSFGKQYAFNLALARGTELMAKTINVQQTLIKSMGDRLEKIENTPMPRAGVASARALKKGFGAGEPTNGTELPPRDDMIKGFIALNKASADGKAPCGRDITSDTAAFESFGAVHPSMLADINKVLGRTQ